MLLILLILVIFTSCKKDVDVELEYDTYVGNITYNEKNECVSYQKFYYKNNNLIKEVDSFGITNYIYDSNNNLVKVNSRNGNYNLYEYNSQNKLLSQKEFNSNTLEREIQMIYQDTLLIKKTYNPQRTDSMSFYYFYDSMNRLDSVRSKWGNSYHSYTPNSHKIIQFNGGLKTYEKNFTYENGKISRSIYSEFDLSGVVSYTSEVSYKYNEIMNIVKIVMKSERLGVIESYREDRFSYNEKGKLSSIETYTIDSKLIKYEDYTYTGDKLVKTQYYDADGNKISHTIVEYAYKK